ncbi:Cytochrome C oxidase, cbb3-type, subunit III [Spirosomataceae bacterium TFI 002]|nr:Cytochrome C oxidase, cbb3-type, subunit III [Spirosomataceae bacterium TFI 002]
MNVLNIGKKLLAILFLFSFFSFIHTVFYTEPEISLEDYHVEDGFELSLIAANPHIEAPVTMDFDNEGRMWVVEMRGYMPNIEGIGEEEPNGRITILEDRDKDGRIDHTKVFMDGLVLPRAIAHVYGGLLYTDGPALYFVTIKNDKPGKKTLVDPIYADGGNVEHQPNGLMMNIDNWIYNANTHFRYRLVGKKWLKEPTSYRGQWGITKDNFGRLYVNNNSTQIQGDHVLPNTVIRNQYYKPRYSTNQTLTRNQKVYPLHATAVNRGYQKGVLDEKGFLTNVTAACGPLVYRGGNFPDSYDQNAFVCIPEANLIKRNLLAFEGTEVKATQAWDDKEFIASTDEGFRPVNLFNGPDGAMYIVDMHRGIIQHKAFISQYLTKLLGERQLDTLMHQGRILKVVAQNKALDQITNLSKAKPKELVAMLKSPNGWIRDRAQQLLIQKKAKSVKAELWELSKTDNKFSTSVHALYVLEGLNLLSFEGLNEILTSNQNVETQAHALRLLEQFNTKENASAMATLSAGILAKDNKVTDLYLAISLNPWVESNPNQFLNVLAQISNRYPKDKVIQEAVVSSLEGKEQQFIDNYENGALIQKYIKEALKNKDANEMNSIFVVETRKDDNRTNGLKLYRTICGACHGADGSGITDLAPPLKGSEYIDGSIHRLASIILHGLSGPIHVNGQLYELNNDMPALLNNPDISDNDIVDIVQFLQNAFAKEGKRISANEVNKLRNDKPKDGLYSEKELLEKVFEK